MEEILAAFINEELLENRTDVSLGVYAPLIDGGDLNSLGMMRLIVFIETELGVPIPLLDVTPENFESIAILSDYIRRQSACHAAKAG